MVITQSRKVFGSWGFVDSMVSILWFAVLVMALCLVNTFVFLAIPLVILSIWTLLLMDVADLPEALLTLKDGVVGLKERALGDKTVAQNCHDVE